MTRSKKSEGSRTKAGEKSAVSTIKTDAPFHSEEEFDALYERDSVVALSISREPHQLRQLIDGALQSDTNVPLPPRKEVLAVSRVENAY
ncbi:MAG: hypothetical protein JSU71_13500 [Betaproteobacteria bacterium]|nr:MAG: hypothetical protein JSU71_13500 [Betaproteobacteria bacterium]